MGVSDKLAALMNAARDATGLTSKLSISDLTNDLAGLLPINYIDDPTTDPLTIETTNGKWGDTYYSATLSKGVYCFSANVISNSTSKIAGRCTFIGDARAHPVGDISNAWGFAGPFDYGAGYSGEMTMAFEVTTPGKFYFGYSGIPWTGGELIVSKPMINRGLSPLPFTKNKLGGG